MQYKGRTPVLVAIRSDPVGRAASAGSLLPPSFLVWQARLVQTWFTSPGYGGLVLAGIRIQFLHPLNYQAAMRRMLFLGWGAKQQKPDSHLAFRLRLKLFHSWSPSLPSRPSLWLTGYFQIPSFKLSKISSYFSSGWKCIQQIGCQLNT